MGRPIYRQALQLLLPQGMPLQLSLQSKTEGRLDVASTTERRTKTQREKQAGGLHVTSLCVLHECSLSACLMKNAVAKAGEEKQVGRHTETARCRQHTTWSSTGWFTLKYSLLSTLSSLLI